MKDFKKRPRTTVGRDSSSFIVGFLVLVLFSASVVYLVITYTLLSWKISSIIVRDPNNLLTEHINGQRERFHFLSSEFYRYDEVGLNVEELDNPQGNVSYVPCIPQSYRLPASAMNVTDYFNDPQNVYPNREYMFEYNPSIVNLPSQQQSQQPGGVYVASFRVSNQHYCFHPADRKQMMNGNKQNKDYLGLVLLTRDFQPLRSVVVDLKKAGFRAAEDFRLFTLKDQIYISSNDLIAPLWLEWSPSQDKDVVQVPMIFGDWKVFVGNQPSCAGCGRPNTCGKNFNYFVNRKNTTSFVRNDASVLVEIWPSSPHLVHSINLSKPCQRRQEPSEVYSSQDSPVRSYATIEEKLFPEMITSHEDSRGIFTRGRGGACCIEIPHPFRKTASNILVGIQHSKTPSQGRLKMAANVDGNHYLSSFYAFEATAPYQLVAQSGYFCLPFAESNEVAGPSNTPSPFAAVRGTAWRTLKMGNETFPKCPRIHFVSGMVLEEPDKKNLIVSYGVNDCYSRLIKIPLSEVTRFLFGRQSER